MTDQIKKKYLGQPYFDQMTGQWVQPSGPDQNQDGFQLILIGSPFQPIRERASIGNPFKAVANVDDAAIAT